MYNANQKIQKFTDLNAWREGHKLVLMIYQATKLFPKNEMFGLTNQIRRAAVSITSNIAEGFNRQSNKEKINFYYTSVASTAEVQNQILIAKDIGYTDKDKFTEIANQSVTVHKLINGLIKYLKTHNT
ncbi:MAG: four helix bundle protein [Patescibacteria group bacterium]